MTAILTPALALRHLLQLSTDVRAAVVLSAGALEPLAREPGAAAAAATAPPPGTVLAASDEQHVLAVAAGPHALLPLLRHDLVALLGEMRTEQAGEAASTRVQVLERADSAVSAAIFAGLGMPAAGNS